MSFKFLRGDSKTIISNVNTFTIQPRRDFDDAEFCFQFDDEDPQVFTISNNPMTITINPTPDGNITFTSVNGRSFKIFARQR